MKGITYENKQNMHSTTVKWYVLDARKLFAFLDFPNQTNFDNEDNWANIIASNLKREEHIATQRNPLTNDFFAELFIMADVAHDNSAEALVCNVVALGRIIGPWASEYAQTTQTKVDKHKYPGGSKLIKAFIGDDFQLFGR